MYFVQFTKSVYSVMTQKYVINKHSNDEGSDWQQILAIIAASLISLSSAVLFAWPSPSIPILISDSYPIKITLEEASYVTVLPGIAMIIFSPITGRIIDILGRKKSLIFIAIPQLIAWALIGYGGSIYIFYVSRFIYGISESITNATVPCYIAEVSTPRVRCTWGNALSCSRFVGIFLMYVLGSYLSIRLTSYIFATIPFLLLILVTLLLPETPYFLIMKGFQNKAKKSLQWLRKKQNVDDELMQLTTDVNRQLLEPGRFKDLLTISSNRRALFVGIIIKGAQQYSGIAIISTYTHFILEKSGSNISTSTSAIICSGFLIVANFSTSFLLIKMGRRLSMIVSCLGCAIFLTLLAVYFYLNEHTNINLESFFLLPLILMLLYILFFSLGLGAVPNMIFGELFSSSIKGKALCVMNTFHGFYLSTSLQIFSYLLIKFGIFASFVFFGICNFLNTLTSYYFIPETKDKTLEQIQQKIKSQSNNSE